MGYRTFAALKIALIGESSNVENYAIRYAKEDHDVLLAWKGSNNKKISPALEAFDNIRVCSIEEAAEAADFIILAVMPKDVREVAYWLGDVRKKIIIDATGNFYIDREDQVNTFWAIKAITGSIHVVRVFSTRGYEKMLKPLFGHDKIQLVMAGDSKKAKEIVKIMGVNTGINTFFDMGGSEAIPLLNELTAAWHKLALSQDKTVIATNPIRI